MTPEVEKAIAVIMQELGKYEHGAMGGKAVVEIEPAETHVAEARAGAEGGMGEKDADDGADCPECAAGTCDNPAHMDDASCSAMMGDLG